MKNLLIYTGPSKKFSDEDAILARIQIDNSLDIGWKKEDIVFVTDFPFAYNGIKSLVVPDNLYYHFDLNANKSIVTLHLIQNGIIEPTSLYWCHDFDAYENTKIDQSVLDLDTVDLGLTHYTYKPEWQFGSFFFKQSAKDIFELLNATILARPHLSRNNEKTLTWLIKHNAINPQRYKRLNVTYNIMSKYLQTIYREAIKPIHVLHFRPSTALDIFMHSKNNLNLQLMDNRLVKIFQYHGLK